MTLFVSAVACQIALVERSTRGVTLTDAGQLLLATADAVHAELQTAARLLRDLRASGPQTLTVATFPSAGEPLLAPALTGLAAAGSDVEITVIEAEPDDALTHLRSGDADLALVYHFHRRKPPDHWSKVAGPASYVPLVDDHIRLLVPNSHRLADQTTVAFHALQDERCIQGWGDTGAVLDTFAAAGGFTPRIACRSSDYRFMSALVSAAVGIALVPRLVLPRRSDLRDLALSPSPTRYVGAYQPGRRHPHQAADHSSPPYARKPPPSKTAEQSSKRGAIPIDFVSNAVAKAPTVSTVIGVRFVVTRCAMRRYPHTVRLLGPRRAWTRPGRATPSSGQRLPAAEPEPRNRHPTGDAPPRAEPVKRRTTA